MNAKERKQFFSLVRAFLLDELGAVPKEPGSLSEFVLQTKAGKLSITLSEFSDASCTTIFGRFDDPERAAKLPGIDSAKISGKWNHHYFDKYAWTVHSAFAHYAYWLRRVTQLP